MYVKLDCLCTAPYIKGTLLLLGSQTGYCVTFSKRNNQAKGLAINFGAPTRNRTSNNGLEVRSYIHLTIGANFVAVASGRCLETDSASVQY